MMVALGNFSRKASSFPTPFWMMTIEVSFPTPGAMSAAVLSWSTALFVHMMKSNFWPASATVRKTMAGIRMTSWRPYVLHTFVRFHVVFPMVLAVN
jgi:hypothetical protein